MSDTKSGTLKMRDWIVKVMKPAPENLQCEMEVSAATIQAAIAVTLEMVEGGFIWSVTTKKPKPEDIRKS